MAGKFGGVRVRYSKGGKTRTGFTSMSVASSQLLKSLNDEIRKIEGDIDNGLEAVGKFIIGKAMEITPVDKGFLIGSAFSDFIRRARRATVRVGYTIKYAAAVHEMPPETNWGKASAENKFLEKAIFRNVSTILEIIKRHAKR